MAPGIGGLRPAMKLENAIGLLTARRKFSEGCVARNTYVTIVAELIDTRNEPKF